MSSKDEFDSWSISDHIMALTSIEKMFLNNQKIYDEDEKMIMKFDAFIQHNKKEFERIQNVGEGFIDCVIINSSKYLGEKYKISSENKQKYMRYIKVINEDFNRSKIVYQKEYSEIENELWNLSIRSREINENYLSLLLGNKIKKTEKSRIISKEIGDKLTLSQLKEAKLISDYIQACETFNKIPPTYKQMAEISSPSISDWNKKNKLEIAAIPESEFMAKIKYGTELLMKLRKEIRKKINQAKTEEKETFWKNVFVMVDKKFENNLVIQKNQRKKNLIKKSSKYDDEDSNSGIDSFTDANQYENWRIDQNN